MFSKILVAVDQSAIGELAFTTGLSLAKAYKAQLMLAHVVSPSTVGYLNPIYPVPDSIYFGGYSRTVEDYKQAWDAVEESASRLLAAFQQRATDEGVLADVTQPIGEPSVAICQTADSWKADLIVIGRHHRSKIGELFWGSVSNFVMHHANCFVLLAQEKPE